MTDQSTRDANSNGVARILSQFTDKDGNQMTKAVDLPLSIDIDGLQLVCDALREGEESMPYTFYIGQREILHDLKSTLEEVFKQINTEKVLEITCKPRATYRVAAIERHSASIPGHSEPVISVAFNLDGRGLASGSGDKTLRLWDVSTTTPLHCCKGHNDWVLCVAWSPDGELVSSADKSGVICIWDSKSGAMKGKQLTGHKSWITCLSWQPYHSNPDSRRFCSSSKDTTVRIWDAYTGKCELILSGHTKTVTCVKWGGSGLIYTSSQDTTIKVWRDTDGVLCRTLTDHGHWVNVLSLSTDYAIKIAFFDPSNSNEDLSKLSTSQRQSRALNRYSDARGDCERIVSGSDDFTLILWRPENEKKPVERMTGHQQLINDVKFSPDGLRICSASFDKSIKVWHGITGKFLFTLRGHVQPVYQVSFSSDSCMVASASADSTLKVFDLVNKVRETAGSTKTKKTDVISLDGHQDQVFALEWSPDGSKIVSGGKDTLLHM